LDQSLDRKGDFGALKTALNRLDVGKLGV